MISVMDKDGDQKLKFAKELQQKLVQFRVKEASLFVTTEFATSIFKELEEANIDLEKYAYSLDNIEGRGSYFTPSSFKHFLQPFVDNSVFVGQVNVFDPSVGKGTLLDFIDGPNVRKFGNDINPLSLEVYTMTQ